jgi:signal transduction histidine kinase
MKRNSLGWWLAAINVLIVLVVAAGVSWVAIGLLQKLADGQQRVRVQLAAADARAELARVGEDTLSSARILAERPTLRRLLQQRDLANLPSVLQRFCQPAGLACALLEGDVVLAATDSAMPWSEMIPAVREQGERFMFATAGSADAYLGAAVPMGAVDPGARVMVVHVLGDAFARRLAPQDGVEIHLRSYRNFNNAPADQFTSLHTTALADGRLAVAHIPKLGLYAASNPVFSATGEGIVLIETRLSSAPVDRDVRALRLRLLLLAAFLGAAALVGSVLLGRRVTRPTEALTAAAERLGQGDFTSSIPQGGPAEIGKLARTMDDMRRNLVDLTGTMRQREAEAQAVLSGIVEGVYAVDSERRITYMNDQAARLLGVTAQEVIGRFCGDALKPRCAANGDAPCEALCPILLARQQGSATAVEHLRTDAGERRMVITSAQPVENLQVQVIRDETELEAVRRARDTVLANVSHEFRTPLAAQLASIELLREGLYTRTPQQLEELVLSLERGTLRLTQLIDNLLESVRIESGQLEIRRQSIELHDVIEDAVGTVEALLRQRGQHVELALEEGLALNGDAVRLTQVFVNLLANASKFGPQDSTLRIGAQRSQDSISAWVEDSGPGLPEGAQENVFERFSRGGVEPAPSGMGLGLSISRSIIERHGGRLAAARTDDGFTRFTLTLPLESA